MEWQRKKLRGNGFVSLDKKMYSFYDRRKEAHTAISEDCVGNQQVFNKTYDTNFAFSIEHRTLVFYHILNFDEKSFIL